MAKIGRPPMEPLERLMDKFDIAENGCWQWTDYIKPDGYAVCRPDRSKGKQPAHRVMYELIVGSIPPETELDHMCSNRSCVNPDHLAPVSKQENIRRGWERRRWQT